MKRASAGAMAGFARPAMSTAAVAANRSASAVTAATRATMTRGSGNTRGSSATAGRLGRESNTSATGHARPEAHASATLQRFPLS
jgi:hypothetical protein